VQVRKPPSGEVRQRPLAVRPVLLDKAKVCCRPEQQVDGLKCPCAHCRLGHLSGIAVFLPVVEMGAVDRERNEIHCVTSLMVVLPTSANSALPTLKSMSDALITPEQIRNTVFTTAKRGYAAGEVDAILASAAATLETVVAERDKALAEIESLREQVASHPTPSVDGEEPLDPEFLRRVFLRAQATCDQVVAEAHEEASRILAEATAEAVEERRKLEAANITVQDELHSLQRSVETTKAELRALAKRVLEVADETSAQEVNDPVTSPTSVPDSPDTTSEDPTATGSDTENEPVTAALND
jgi:DivIVA domain-containing protein